jgi:hypothetical protein
MKLTTITIILSLSCGQALADNYSFQFANPAFNGGPGYSDHVLRMEQLEKQRAQAKSDAAKAEEEKLKTELENSLMNKFLENVNSRIYATLSKKLVDAMFADGGAASGTVTLDGAIVVYTKTDTEISLHITDPDGNVTEVVIPIGGFNF